MPRKYRFFSCGKPCRQAGFIDIFSLVAVVFLITTAITGVVVVNKQNSNFDIREKAAKTCDKNLILNTAGTCPDGKTIKYVRWADNCVDMVTDTCTETQNKPSCVVGTIVNTAGTCPDGKTIIYKRLNADCVTTTTDSCPTSTATEETNTQDQVTETLTPPLTTEETTTTTPNTQTPTQLSCMEPCTTDSECEANEYCYRPTSGCPVCKAKGTLCTPGAKQCSGNYSQTCNSRGISWDSENCGSAGCNTTTFACNPQSQSTTSPTCNNQCLSVETCVSIGYGYYGCQETKTISTVSGTSKCNGSNLETWNGSKWNAIYCENGCENDICNPIIVATPKPNLTEWFNSAWQQGSETKIDAGLNPISPVTTTQVNRNPSEPWMAENSTEAVAYRNAEYGFTAAAAVAPLIVNPALDIVGVNIAAGGSLWSLPTAAYSYTTAAIATSPVLQTGLAIATLSQFPATVAVCNKYGASSAECINATAGVTAGYLSDPIGSEQVLQASYQQLRATTQQGLTSLLNRFVRSSPPIDLPELDVPGVIDLVPNADRTRWSLPTDMQVIDDSFPTIDLDGTRLITPQELDLINPTQIVPYEDSPLAPIVTVSDPVFAISPRPTQIIESPMNVGDTLSSPIDVALNLPSPPSRSNLPLALDIEPYNLTSSPDFPNLLAEAPTIIGTPEIAPEIPNMPADIPTENLTVPETDAVVPPIQESSSQPSLFQKAKTALFGEPQTVNLASINRGDTVTLFPGDSVSGVVPSLDAKPFVPELSSDTKYYWNTSSDPTVHELTPDGIPVRLDSATVVYIDTTPTIQGGRTPYELTITQEKNVPVTINRANPEPGFFTIRDPEGNWFPGIRRLFGSTTTNPPEVAVNYSQIARDNAKLILEPANNREFTRVFMDESIGGNAGEGYSAVNATIDRNGKITSFGNIQDLTPEVRTMLETGELQRISIRVKAYPQVEGPNYTVDYDGESVSPEIQSSITDLETRLNQPTTKASLFGLQWNGFTNSEGQIQWPIGITNAIEP